MHTVPLHTICVWGEPNVCLDLIRGDPVLGVGTHTEKIIHIPASSFGVSDRAITSVELAKKQNTYI